ncbi:MAG: TrmH family RNA methyltransferase, partial [Bacteroidota bacterium]|nr:TrmH family RNA methyltransferase [Bacteroidota bacterium]
TEMNGLSEIALNNADEYLFIPMYGFTESLNISVSAAIVLHHLSSKLKEMDIDWELTDQEKMELKLNWLRQSIKRADLHEKEFLRKRPK